MANYVLDIETCANPQLIEIFAKNIKAPKNIKSKEKIDEYVENAKQEAIKKMMVDIDYCDIACIAIKKQGEDAKIYTLEEFAKWYSLLFPGDRIIVFNGIKFDLPILLRQCAKKSLDLPYRALQKDIKDKYGSKIIDLMVELGNFGDWKSLDTYLQIYCGIEKTPIDFMTCTQEELEKHCLEDTSSTEKLYNVFEKIFN